MEIKPDAESTSLVSRNVVIEGQIEGQENLKIDGNIKGQVKIKGNIIVGATGIVEAEVEADNIIIEGSVKGNVLAREHLEIQATGKMTGDISAQTIDIKEGSTFEGRSHMIKSEKAPIAQTIPEKAAEPVESENPESS